MELQVVDIEDMTLDEINNKIKKLENNLNFYLKEKERYFTKTQPKATDIQSERISGGTRLDKFACYVIECEDKGIDIKIENLQEEIKNLVNYLDDEMKRLKLYGELESQIIVLRETKKLKWYQISMETNYSERQCRRIYSRYRGKRSI